LEGAIQNVAIDSKKEFRKKSKRVSRCKNLKYAVVSVVLPKVESEVKYG
jgi:hypothetical protein